MRRCASTYCVFCLLRLRELCVKLMFLHPVDYGRKAEELLWRKVYYEVIQVIKTNKKVLTWTHNCYTDPDFLFVMLSDLEFLSGLVK